MSHLGTNVTSFTDTNGLIMHLAGTFMAPSVTHIGEVGTGLFWPGSNSLGFATSSLEAGRFDSSQNLILTNALGETSGGTGQSAYAVGDILFASS